MNSQRSPRRALARTASMAALLLLSAPAFGAISTTVSPPRARTLTLATSADGPHSPTGLRGVYYSFVLNEEGNYDCVGWFEVGEEEGGELPITGGTGGGGYIIPDSLDPSHYEAHFDALAPYTIDLDFGSASGCFEFSFGGQSGKLVPYGEPGDSIPPPLPDPGPGWGHHGRGMTFWVDVTGFPWVYDVDYIQFSRISLTFEMTDGSSPPQVSPASSDPVPATGNGGFKTHDPVTGQGMELMDGSTMYVDSGSPGEPRYIAAGGWGTTNGGVVSMIDEPGYPEEDLKAEVADLQAGLPAPWHITSASMYITFSTYLIVNDNIVYVWHTRYSSFLNADTGEFYETCELIDEGPASSMTPSESAALSNFQAGGFSGAP